MKLPHHVVNRLTDKLAELAVEAVENELDRTISEGEWEKLSDHFSGEFEGVLNAPVPINEELES